MQFKKFIFASALFTVLFFAAASPMEPVAVLSIRDLSDFIQKTSQYAAAGNPKDGAQTALLLNFFLMSPQVASLDTRKPITGYLYFAEPALQPVLFGSLRNGINPVEIPFLPGQNLVPEVRGSTVVYYDKEFARTALSLDRNAIPVPDGELSGVYFFRGTFPDSESDDEMNTELAHLISTELSKITFSAGYPQRNLLRIQLEMEANKDGDLVGFSNMERPALKEMVQILPESRSYTYMELPANMTIANGISVFHSVFAEEFLDLEHIYGQFLNTVISGTHDTALAVSRSQDFFLFSGILPEGTLRLNFETFLKDNGESYDGKTFVFHKPDGVDIFLRINGNIANLLIKTTDGKPESLDPVFRSLQNGKIPMQGREFLISLLRKNDGTYERQAVGTMSNGKFHLELNLYPQILRLIK